MRAAIHIALLQCPIRLRHKSVGTAPAKTAAGEKSKGSVSGPPQESGVEADGGEEEGAAAMGEWLVPSFTRACAGAGDHPEQRQWCRL